MTSKIKYIGIFMLFCMLLLAFASGIFVSFAETNIQEQNVVNITTNYNLNNSDNENLKNFYISQDQRGYSSYKYKSNNTDVDFDSGWLYQLSSGSNIGDITLMNAHSGEFDIIAQPVMTQLYKAWSYTDDNWKAEYGKEVPDYKKLEFKFQDLYSQDYIIISLIANKNWQGYTDVKIYYSVDGERKECSLTGNSLLNTSFYGFADFVHDNDGNSVLRNVPLIMRYNPASPSKIYFAHNRKSVISEMIILDGEYLPSIENYSVQLSFLDRNSTSSANIVVYEMCSQRLNGDDASFSDTAAPSLSVESSTYAVKNFSYSVPKAYAYDIVDGNLSNNITVEVKSPSGKTCEIVNGKFQVAESGKYKLNYSVSDKSGKNSSTVVEVVAYAQKPVPEIVKDFELEKEYAKNSTIHLPDAKIRTFLTQENNYLDYYVLVQKNYKVIERFEQIDSKKCFIPNETGKYDVIYVCVDEMGLTFSSISSFECVEDAYFEDVEFPEYIHCGQTFELPQMPLINGNEKIQSSVVKVIEPNAIKEGTITSYNPKLSGKYKFVYQATVNDKIYEKAIAIQAGAVNEALFKNDSGCTVIEGDVNLPSWSKKGNGVKVLGKETYSTFSFLNLIDLNDLTKDDILFQFQVLSGEGYSSFDTVEIELIDENDNNNVVKIKMNSATNDASYRYSYMTVNYDGRYMGLHGSQQNRLAYGTEYGTLFYGSFQGVNLSNHPLFTIRMDYDEKTIYADDVWAIGSGTKRVLDMKDEEIVGQSKAWKGFSTGRVYMRVTMSSITGQGGVIITNVAGNSLYGKMMESEQPVVWFDKTENLDLLSMPVAKKGQTYPIPTAIAYDSIYGKVDLSVDAYKAGSSEKVSIDMENPNYVFNESGNYTICYTATNWDNKKSIVELTVKVVDSLDELKVEFKQTPPTIVAGGRYELPELIATGGSGILKIDYQVSLNGKLLELPENRLVDINETGEIVYEYEVVDYLGNVKEGTLKIDAQNPATNVAIIELNDTMPLSVKKGEKLIFPEFTAIDLNFDKTEEGFYPEKWIEINDNRISSLSEYAVNEDIGTFLKVALCAGETKKVYQVAVIDGTYLKDYLIVKSGSAEIVSTIQNMLVEFSNTPTEILLANRVSQNNLVIKFSVKEDQNSMNDITFVLRDGMDADKYITLTFAPNDDKTSYLILNNDSSKKYLIDGSFSNTAKSFSLTFNGDSGILSTTKTIIRSATLQNKEVCSFKIDKYTNGNRYEGFYKGGVEVSISSQSTSAEKATMSITQVSNQPLLGGAISTGELKVYRDTVSPIFYYFGNVPSGSYSINQEVEFSTAIAYDVLGGRLNVTFSLKNENDEYVFKNEALSQTKKFLLSNYGRYILYYHVVDSTGVQYTEQYPIFVKDEIAPTLSISGSYELNYEKDSILQIYNAQVQDNYSNVELFIILSDPDADTRIVEQGSELKLEKVGVYRLIYQAMDEIGNFTTKEFKFTVTEANK